MGVNSIRADKLSAIPRILTKKSFHFWIVFMSAVAVCFYLMGIL